MSKRRYAYISAPWSENAWENVERADKYQRTVFKAGMIPVCPIRSCATYVNFDSSEEYKAFVDICRPEAQRCPVLVGCGDPSDERVKEDIAIARRAGNTVTTLDGLILKGG